MRRVVRYQEGFKKEVLDQVNALPGRCAASFFFLIEELWKIDPDDGDDCGELDRTYSVYACSIPRCPKWRLVVSIRRDRAETECIVHGLVRSGEEQRRLAYRLAARQLKLESKPWDPI